MVDGSPEPVRVLRRGQVRRQEEWLVTKQEFVDRLASKTDLSRRDAAKAVDAFLETVTESLRAGNDITFTGFGKFSTQHRKERMGVNPRRSEERRGGEEGR